MAVDALSAGALGGVVLVAVAHTALGPDHYVPFVALSRARGWSLRRTLAVTCACGVGHVLSSVLLGVLGLAAGGALGVLEELEGRRGVLAAWALIALGLGYGLLGVRHAWRQRRGLQLHRHGGHVHLHAHGLRTHEHADGSPGEGTVWALFIVFVLGPCEPLIPLFLLPASSGRWGLASVMALVFGAATLVTMLALVHAATRGARLLGHGVLERWSHAVAGAVLAATGCAVLWLPVWPG